MPQSLDEARDAPLDKISSPSQYTTATGDVIIHGLYFERGDRHALVLGPSLSFSFRVADLCLDLSGTVVAEEDGADRARWST